MISGRDAIIITEDDARAIVAAFAAGELTVKEWLRELDMWNMMHLITELKDELRRRDRADD